MATSPVTESHPLFGAAASFYRTETSPSTVRLELMQPVDDHLFTHVSVVHLCTTIVRDRGTAEDLAQDAFGKAFLALPEFRGEASARTCATMSGPAVTNSS